MELAELSAFQRARVELKNGEFYDLHPSWQWWERPAACKFTTKTAKQHAADQPCKVLWEMWWTRRCWKSTSKSMGTLMIFGCHGRQLCCCPFRGDVTYVTIHTSVQLFQLNCTISSFSHDLSWVIKTFMKPGLVKATDLRPFGFVTFKDSAAAQHFVDWSPHKVPDATVEIIAKWKHRHSAIQFHQKLDEISHTDSLQLQKKQNFPRQVGSLIRHARICKSAQEKRLDGRQRSHPVTLQLGSLNR